jgi:arylsulfatase A-like enzyme
VEGAVGLDAIPPTVTGALDVAPADAWAGESLLPSVRGEAVPADRPVVSVTVRGEEVTAQPIPRDLDDGDLLVSARTPTWTYVENVDAGGCELYHRPTDPDQQADRSIDPTADDRAAIERLRPVVREHARRLRRAADREGGEGIAPGPEEPDEAIETRLSALGYR